MIHLEQRQLLAQAVFALTRRGAAAPNRRAPLTQTQIEPLYEGGVDLPAADGQGLFDRQLRAEYDAVLHLDEAPPSHRFDHWCIEQPRQGHPTRLGRGAPGLWSRRLHPVTEMRHHGGEVNAGTRRLERATRNRAPTAERCDGA